MEVTHEVGRIVFITIVCFGQSTILVHFVYDRSRSNIGVGVCRIVVITDASRYIPPVCNLERSVDGAGETIGFVGHLILIDNPVRIFHVAGQIPNAVKQAIFGAILVEIMAHLFLKRPAIKGIHGTCTAAAPQTSGGQCLVGAGDRIGYIGAKGKFPVFLFAIEAYRSLVITGLADDTLLVVV